MICGALQTLNEDAFEDVAVSERPSPTGELSIQQYSLAPISEELGSPHSRSVEDFLNNTANYVLQSNNADELSQSSNSTMLSQNSNSTIIVIHPSGSVDDTRL